MVAYPRYPPNRWLARPHTSVQHFREADTFGNIATRALRSPPCTLNATQKLSYYRTHCRNAESSPLQPDQATGADVKRCPCAPAGVQFSRLGRKHQASRATHQFQSGAWDTIPPTTCSTECYKSLASPWDAPTPVSVLAPRHTPLRGDYSRPAASLLFPNQRQESRTSFSPFASCRSIRVSKAFRELEPTTYSGPTPSERTGFSRTCPRLSQIPKTGLPFLNNT